MSKTSADRALDGLAAESSRRSPTADELRVWRAFIETSEAAKQLVALRLQEDSGLSPGDYAVMVALYDQPGHSMRSSQLAQTISWERSRLSHHLGRMERRGLISRQAAADDNRGAEILLTAEGAHLYRKASSPHLHAIRDIFVTPLSTEQLSLLEDAMRGLAAHLASLR
ncbi:MarR family winged helix-turn-helix transcriptional regulator [uncultured Arthrobacter sp.]|uniref:MarR family winged helix-turn-helix transcriptional regulator n=1 Tax=uncultured Arthrobacter sp. TaxID=114050 RepID=UPI0025DBBE09|nr:MarR family winged helix-turn-helix transcriptional regulator [uncultured Arthrobacter sp.]